MPDYGENLGTLGIETLPVSTPRESYIARSNTPVPFYGGRSPRDESIGYAGQEVEGIKRESFIRQLDQMKKQYQRLGKDKLYKKRKDKYMIAPRLKWGANSGYGIPATNQGYKIMNAGSLSDFNKKYVAPWMGPLIEKLTPKDWEPSRTPWQWLRDWEQSWGQNEGEFAEPEYTDKILRDLYPKGYGLDPATEETLSPEELEQQQLDEFFEDKGPEDFVPEVGYPEIAGIDPSDWRSIVKILEAGGNPDDYIDKKANREGLMSLT